MRRRGTLRTGTGQPYQSTLLLSCDGSCAGNPGMTFRAWPLALLSSFKGAGEHWTTPPPHLPMKANRAADTAIHEGQTVSRADRLKGAGSQAAQQVIATGAHRAECVQREKRSSEIKPDYLPIPIQFVPSQYCMTLCVLLYRIDPSAPVGELQLESCSTSACESARL